MRVIRVILGLLLMVVALPLAAVLLVVKASWNLADNALEWVG